MIDNDTIKLLAIAQKLNHLRKVALFICFGLKKKYVDLLLNEIIYEASVLLIKLTKNEIQSLAFFQVNKMLNDE